MKHLSRSLVLFAVAATAGAAMFAAAPVSAQEVTARASEDAAPAENSTNLEFAAGGVLNTGNTESYTFTTGGVFNLVRDRNVFNMTSTFNIGGADVPDDMRSGYDLNARNWITTARYDRFFTDMDAGFVGASHRWDTFASLDARVQVRAGYLRNFLKEENHRFWMELGYDLTWDNTVLSDEQIMMGITDDTDLVHAARGYLGYTNDLNEHARVAGGIEVLQNVEDGEDTRVNFDAAFRSAISERFKLELKFRLLYDRVPAGDAEELDTQTTINLIVDAI